MNKSSNVLMRGRVCNNNNKKGEIEGDEGETQVSKQTDRHHQQTQQHRATNVVKRSRSIDKDKKDRQQKDKSMHANVLNVLQSMKQMTDEQVKESFEKLLTRQAGLLRLRESKQQVRWSVMRNGSSSGS